MKDDEFDILFVCHEKDKNILKKSIQQVKKNVSGFRKIFVVSTINLLPKNKEVVFIDEKVYPFTKKEIGKFAPGGRAGWYFQQFLALYFLNITGKEVLDNILMINPDVLFIKKVKFFEKGKPLYNFEVGYHQPYYEIMERVFGFGKQNSKLSGTTHHMVFQRKYINEIVDDLPKKGDKRLWMSIMKNIKMDTESGFSEQDFYFNYVLKYHPNKIKIRKLNFIDFPYYTLFWLKIFKLLGYDYIVSHEYFQHQKFPAIRALIVTFLTRTKIKKPLKELLIKLKLFRVK